MKSNRENWPTRLVNGILRPVGGNRRSPVSAAGAFKFARDDNDRCYLFVVFTLTTCASAVTVSWRCTGERSIERRVGESPTTTGGEKTHALTDGTVRRMHTVRASRSHTGTTGRQEHENRARTIPTPNWHGVARQLLSLSRTGPPSIVSAGRAMAVEGTAAAPPPQCVCVLYTMRVSSADGHTWWKKK